MTGVKKPSTRYKFSRGKLTGKRKGRFQTALTAQCFTH